MSVPIELMTREELLIKIEELEKENEKLKGLRARRNKRNTISDKLVDKYIGHYHKRSDTRADLPFIHYGDIVLLSQIIRRYCFKDTLIVNKKYPNGMHSILSLKDMTDQEYEHYTDILDEVLSPFEKYATPK